jgi:hypothetical protein
MVLTDEKQLIEDKRGERNQGGNLNGQISTDVAKSFAQAKKCFEKSHCAPKFFCKKKFIIPY